MVDDADPSDADQPPVRVMALHALAYCRRLFYLEEVEEIRVADHRVYAGRQLHSTLEADEDGESVSVELSSGSLGLTGKVDCVRRRDGSYLPYEHKRGRPETRTTLPSHGNQTDCRCLTQDGGWSARICEVRSEFGHALSIWKGTVLGISLLVNEQRGRTTPVGMH